MFMFVEADGTHIASLLADRREQIQSVAGSSPVKATPSPDRTNITCTLQPKAAATLFRRAMSQL